MMILLCNHSLDIVSWELPCSGCSSSLFESTLHTLKLISLSSGGLIMHFSLLIVQDTFDFMKILSYLKFTYHIIKYSLKEGHSLLHQLHSYSYFLSSLTVIFLTFWYLVRGNLGFDSIFAGKLLKALGLGSHTRVKFKMKMICHCGYKFDSK